MKHRIAISGSYGGLNLGDEAILKVMLSEIQSSGDVDIVVFSRNAADTQQRHGVRAVPIRSMHKHEVQEELKNLDLFVLGGGGLLFEGEVESFLRDVNWAKELGVPVMVYAISAGPLRSAESKRLVVRTMNNVDRITVREPEAKRYLHDLGVNLDIQVTADPALLLVPDPFTEDMLEREGLKSDKPLVGFSVREPGSAAPDLNVEHYLAVLAHAADYMTDRFEAQILFIPMERGEHRDLQYSHAVVSKMANARDAHVLKREYTSAQVLGLVEHMSFVVGMRLHPLIFAAIQNVPFAPLPYASKVSGFLADLEISVPDISEVSIGKLCAFLDRSWDLRKRMRRHLKAQLPPLQKRARRTSEILRELLDDIHSKHPSSQAV